MFRVNGLLNFCLQIGLYLFCVLCFYLATNNYYYIDGKFTDLSLWGWGFMFALWLSAAFSFFYRKQLCIVIFATQVAVICFAFDCWRLYSYGGNETAKLYVQIILVLEAICAILAWRFHNEGLLRSAMIVFLLCYVGSMIAYPVWMSWNNMFIFSGVWTLVALLCQCSFIKIKYIVGGIGVLFCGFLGYLYHNTSGIHFYEEKITKPAQNVKVSVVVPIYNAEKTLERCLDSLRKQTLHDIEIICVNDGSTDKTAQILAQYAEHDARFKIITQKNKYIGAARDAGIAAATGEYVGFVDSDDWVSLNYFEDMYQTALKYKTDIVMTGNVMEVHASATPKRQAAYVDRYFLAKKIIKQPLDDIMLLRRLVWDKIYRRSFLIEHQVKSTYRRAVYEDFYFFLQTVLPQSPIAVAPNAIYYYFMKNTSVSRAKVYNLDDESAWLFVDVNNLLKNYPMSEEVKPKWLSYVQNMRIYYLKDYNEALNTELQSLWQKRCKELFPQDEFNFDQPEQKLNLF